MTEKKPAIERMIVVPRRFGGKHSLLIVALVVGLVVAAVGFGVGALLGEKFAIAHWQQLNDANEQLKQQQSLLMEQEEELARLRIGAEIDRQAIEEVRLTVVAKEQELADLSEEITFYQELMSGASSEKGLTFHNLTINELEAPRQYQYKLVLKQLALRHNLLTVKVRMAIQGEQNGEQVTLDFSEISPMFSGGEQVVRFRYFVNYEGTVELPEGFTPQAVVVDARRVGTSQKIDTAIEWVVEE